LRKARSAAAHSLARDAEQVRFHYDVSDDFYSLWLDPRGVYSCAYFERPGLSLAQAQEAKLDLICRKLQLRPGERFLDIGPGWGALLLGAAEHYGVDATGITLSRNQRAHVQRMSFERGWIALHQMLAARPKPGHDFGGPAGAQSSYPFTRNHMYPCSTPSNRRLLPT